MQRLTFLLATLLLASSAACSDSREPTTTTGPDTGAACATPEDCDEGLTCIDSDRFPGGYCSALCSDASCPEGARCVAGFGAKLCLAECTADGDCRDGYQCWAGVCQPTCESDGECGSAGATCEAGRCSGAECVVDSDCAGELVCLASRCTEDVPGDAGTGLGNGEPCTAPSQCLSGICLPPAQGGVCAASCTDRESCGGGLDLACSPVGLDLDGDGSVDSAVAACVPADPTGDFLAAFCRNDSDCESRVCLRNQCQEACDDDIDCLFGQVCTDIGYPGADAVTYRGCGYTARSGAVAVDDVSLGSPSVSTGFPSSRINFAIPNDAVSVTLMGRTTAGTQIPLSFINVWDPTNARSFDYAELVSWVDQPVRWLPINSEEQISMLIPNSTPDRITFRRGRYGFTVAGLSGGTSGSATVELSARVKRASGGDVSSGTLDLNVFLVGLGITASAARTHTRLQNALSELDSILGAAGVSIGTIDYIEIGGSAGSTFGVIDSSDGPDSEMARLLRMSEGRTNEAINVFLVRGISEGAGESGGIALGIAGGIPGPPGVHGTGHSGVLVSFDTSVVGTDHRVVAQIAAHEIGHYLGLYHNRENARVCPDGTGPTESDPCAPFGGGDVLEDTSRSDGNNLMWYALGGADGRTYITRLSDGQSFVLLRSAVVR